MNRPGTRTAGLTLVELLVGMALMGVILLALVNFFGQSSRISAQSSTRAELQQEMLNAQQLIVGKLKEAWYVYPPGQAIAMVSTNAPTSRNPTTGNQNWTVNTHPILAMILPPAAGTTAYRFLAYYPVKRSVWVTGTAATSWRNPGPDDSNGNAWVLVEYRANLASSPVGATFPPSSAPAVPMGGEANILSDYVAPAVAITETSGFTTSANTYTMFTYAAADGNPPSATNPVSSVTINLAVARQSRGTLLRLPNATDEYSITVYPANLGKVAVN
ncbi:prepilin-type cleavage/methylation domain-containing protein [Deinococcus sp. SDU3-2]|uniref:Prepilin-type cleavage/methylation domain-containing protein n=1 Tax=Deinococcus terrestris TaxID=2651870 RepID=A0A7X1TRN2_9DEIO|nr:prepilin-type cleavage/methylation domain-containing protein [Deinococcus terrestris]MPY66596.1 prepilin-type cleavage/methylation domain-containing protein [Deinococcus terrestris]